MPTCEQPVSACIPQDWEVRPLGEIASVSAGGTPSRTISRYWGGDIPWVTTTEITGRIISCATQYITRDGLENSAAKLLAPGTLLMALYGQGKTRGKVGILGIAAATNQACAAIRLRQGIWTDFVFYFLSSRYEAIRSLSNTGNQDNLNGRLVRSIPVWLPPTEDEQRSIASALSDVDGMIDGLDRLIVKKRDLKQAIMQQLLTGQTRLPGFHGGWEMKRLGDHVAFLRHGVNSRAELLAEGRVKYVHYGDVHACKDVYLSPALLPCLPDARAGSLDRLRDGDLILADASEDIAGVCKSVEVREVGATEVVAGQHTIAARFDKDVLADGFKGFLQHCPQFATHLRRLAAGTKVYATNRAHVASVEMHLPTVPEQTAIATVLSDMDTELSVLQARRDKTRDLKQAMMRQLLTGMTRLV